MKIVCEKGSSAQQMLELVDELVGKLSVETPILADDMVLDINLQGKNGTPCADNESRYCFTAADLQAMSHKLARANHAYSYDALTGLYNRGRYEFDIAEISACVWGGVNSFFACILMRWGCMKSTTISAIRPGMICCAALRAA